MKHEPVYVKVDSRNRITLTRASKNLSAMYKISTRGNTIVLEPVIEIPEREAWLFKPENKHILDRVKKGLKEGGTIDLGSFKKYSKKTK